MSKKKKEELQFYSLDNILKRNAHYNVIIGERSNGKTTAVLKYCLKHFVETGKETAYIRRYEDDLKGSKGESVFSGLLNLGGSNYIEEITEGHYTTIVYRGRTWYLAVYDEIEEKLQLQPQPFARAFALTQQERYKGLSYPDIDTVLFDEFLTRGYYLHDEFITYMNLLSTIIRQRDGIKIFMLGNTVNKYSPYFAEMGLKHVKDMKKGSIDLYTYGKTELKVAVEFADFPSKEKPSDVYFAFDNPRLNMITGQGMVWEIAIYPHAPMKWKPKDIMLTYFIIFEGDTLQCEIIAVSGTVFTFIHRKTTELQDPDHDLIFTPDYDPRHNWRRKLTKPFDQIGRRIAWFYAADKVYYQDNEVGEVVRNYLQFSNT